MTDDTKALLDQTGDFRRRGMDGAVASNERVLAGRVPALLDRIESLRSALDRITEWAIENQGDATIPDDLMAEIRALGANHD